MIEAQLVVSVITLVVVISSVVHVKVQIDRIANHNTRVERRVFALEERLHRGHCPLFTSKGEFAS